MKHDSQTILNVNNLSKSYGSFQAIQDIDFSIGPGAFGLLGPNGAGKSTLMNILATTLKPSFGSAYFLDQDMQSNPDFVRSRLGFLPQSFGFYPRTKARTMLDYIATLKGLRLKITRSRHVDQLLDLVNLSADSHRFVDQFSGGMKQRFGLAQALLGDPRLLILDEPTTGLDPYERNHIQHVLARKAENSAIILSTHLVADVDNLCSQIMILNKGKIRYLGKPADLIQQFEGFIQRVPLEAFQEQLGTFLHQRFFKGKAYAHYLMEAPEQGDYSADLEDAYFAVLAGGLA